MKKLCATLLICLLLSSCGAQAPAEALSVQPLSPASPQIVERGAADVLEDSADDSEASERADTPSPPLPASLQETASEASLENVQEESEAPSPDTLTYVLNHNSKKFHYLSCHSVAKIKPKNYGECVGRDQAVTRGYSPCGSCKP